jgi:hypothetical protein
MTFFHVSSYRMFSRRVNSWDWERGEEKTYPSSLEGELKVVDEAI